MRGTKKIRNGFILLGYFIYPQMVIAQNAKSPVKLSGDFGIYGDLYKMNADTMGAVAPRRPDALGRLVMNFSIDIKEFSMPFTMALPTWQNSVVIPQIPPIPKSPLENFKVQVKNPLNRVGFAPKYKWIQVLVGSQIPQYSELSVGDLPVFGAGIALTPKKFRLSCFVGTSQFAVESDTNTGIQGIYARKIYTAKIGFGHEDSSHIYLIGSKMMDDTNSLFIKPPSLMPQAGILSSLDFRINFGKKIFLKGEIAGSVFTRDEMSNELPAFTPSVPKGVFTPRESSRADYASVVSIGGNWKKFGLKSTGRYYGDGFVTFGYPFMQMDRLEVTIDPRFALFKDKFQLSGSVGKRVNNLSGIRAATATQTIGAANVNIQLTQNLSVNGNYSNFGFRNTVLNDTFRVEMVTESWSVSPSLNINAKRSQHNLSFMFSQNTFKDFNLVSGALNDNDASNGVFSYMVSGVNKPLSIGTMVSYFHNQTSYGRLLTKSVNITAGYKFFKKKLHTSFGLTGSENHIDNATNGFQLMPILALKYTMKKKIQFALTGSMNIFDYGDARPGISYREDFLRSSITYKL